VSNDYPGPGPDLKPLNITGYPLADAARVTGVSHRTMRRAVRDGRVKAIPIPPHYKLIPPEEVERLLAEGLRQRAPGAGGRPKS
jgi:hypothetical protein